MTLWTEPQIQFVSDNAGWYSNKQLGVHLGKSEEAVKLYRCRNRLPKFTEVIYTMTLLGNELGRHRKTIAYWYKTGLIKGKKASWSHSRGKNPAIFRQKDVDTFLKDYAHKLDHTKIPNRYFANLVRQELERRVE